MVCGEVDHHCLLGACLVEERGTREEQARREGGAKGATTSAGGTEEGSPIVKVMVMEKSCPLEAVVGPAACQRQQSRRNPVAAHHPGRQVRLKTRPKPPERKLSEVHHPFKL